MERPYSLVFPFQKAEGLKKSLFVIDRYTIRINIIIL